MKKLIALLMTLIMTLGIATTAFAADAPTSVEFKKKYKVTGDDQFPAETLEFEVTADASNPDESKLLTVGNNGKVKVDDSEVTVTAMLPEYTEVGVYKYTIKEKAGKTQGVTYGTDSVSVSVLVLYDNAGNIVVEKAGVTKPENGEKEDTITNEYKTGNLAVNKTVTGNLGDKTKYFDITVTFTAESGKEIVNPITYTGGKYCETKTVDNNTVVIEVKHDDTITFSNIPDGVTYTVVEKDYKSEGYTSSGNVESPTKITSGETKTVEITNENSATVDTGINLDSLPYILVLAGVVLAAIVLVVRKRRSISR